MRKYTVFNAESAYFYFKDRSFRQDIIGSEKLFCDSVSLSLALRIIGIPHRRLHGPDFMHHYLAHNPAPPVLIIGGSSVAHKAIGSKYHLQAATYIDQKVTDAETEQIARTIFASKPHMIFVCLGLRKQERIVNQLWVNAPESEAVIIGVGAAVDFLGGTKKRASERLRLLGFEWLPRLFREPRMAPRILRSIVGCFLILGGSKQLILDDLSFARSFPTNR